MTTLEAVNEILGWIGQPAVTALDTGGNSDEGEAEAFLDRKRREVLKRGWHANTEDQVDFGVPTVRIAASGGSGTFTYAEVVTQAVSGATGYFAYEEGGFVYLNLISGTFVSGQNITGGTSAATRTGGAYTAVTSAKIAYPAAIVFAEPSEAASEDHIITMRGGFFYDTEDNTTTFTAGDGLTLRIYRLLAFTDIPTALAEYITKEAAMSFLKYKFPGGYGDTDERRLEILRAKAEALQEDLAWSKTNVNESQHAYDILGERPHGGVRVVT